MPELYSGPWFGPSSPKGPERGPAMVGLKRTLARWGGPDVFPWKRFDDRFNVRLENAVKKFQRRHHLKPHGQVGRKTFDLLLKAKRHGHPAERAMDNVALDLFEEAWLIEHGPQVTREAVWDGIADYCKRMEEHRDVWHYLQARPMKSKGRKPERGGTSDCSELATVALYWARLESDVPVPDPNGRAYDGYGYTGTLYPYNLGRRVSPPYQVGDMAFYGTESRTTHVTICRQGGSDSDAIFTSNGSEAGPMPTRASYRSDFVCVLRPQLRAEKT
jgi:Putative peptidoglycan binding domain